jgi:hypothetical protein
LIVIPTVNAQDSVVEKAQQKLMEITINSLGEIHVKHIVKFANIPTQIELVNGTVSNLKVTNEESVDKQYEITDDKGVLIMPSTDNTIVEYNLTNAMVLRDNLWFWNFRYLEDVTFILPKDIDLIFVNNKPVYLDEVRGIKCHGCQMILEYAINEPKITKNVKWGDKEFLVEFRSLAKIDKINFDQPTKNISFELTGENQFVTVIIPHELLSGPYDVKLENEKIFSDEYIKNGTHVWVSMKPSNSGNVSVIGTTVIPEFPLIGPIALGLIMIIILPIMLKILPLRKRTNLH